MFQKSCKIAEAKFNRDGVRIAVKWGLFNLQTSALGHLAGHIHNPVDHEQNNVKADSLDYNPFNISEDIFLIYYGNMNIKTLGLNFIQVISR